MFGGSETGENLLYRPIGKFCYPGESESQWTIMTGRCLAFSWSACYPF